MKKALLILIPLLLIAGGAYYWFLMRTPATITPEVVDESSPVFTPIRRGTITPPAPGGSAASSTSGITQAPIALSEGELPRLRKLSVTPVGGFMASSTASSSLVRYVDRGVGHIYEASSTSNLINKITNTTIPRVYESFWNKNLTAAVMRYMKDETGTIVNFYGEIRPFPKNASNTDTTTVVAEIKGKFLSSDIKEVAVSPKGDRIFTWNVENGNGVGYISGLDESKKVKVIESPITQVNIDWPEENTVALTPKATALAPGYAYLINLKKPAFQKIVGSLAGLSAKVSPDLKMAIYSSFSNARGFNTSIFNIKDGTSQEVVFRTAAEKCIWSKRHPAEAYCAVPVEIPTGIYPDDWYRGNVSFTDQIWHIDTTTGEVNIIANLLGLSQELIDAINPALDPKENFLYFINKRDLTLWSLDLTK